MTEYGVKLTDQPASASYDGIILAVAHDAYSSLSAAEIRAFGKSSHVFYDLKSTFPSFDSDLRL